MKEISRKYQVQRERYADIISEMVPVPKGKAGLPPIRKRIENASEIRKQKLNWAGHVVRMEDDRWTSSITKYIVYWGGRKERMK